MFFSPAFLTILYAFYRNRAALDGECSRTACRVQLGGVHCEIRYRHPPDAAQGGLTVCVYEKSGLPLTELTPIEKGCAVLLLRALHRCSRRNTRTEELRTLPKPEQLMTRNE